MSTDLTIDVITIFPDYLAPLRQSLLGKAIERGQVDVRVHDLRRWTDDVHRTVDDAPYGGGPGMVMLAEPWGRALDEISIGDYVLAGGEAAVLVIVEAVARLLPGVLGNAESAVDDSFAAGPAGLLEAPAYTRPQDWRGLPVPPVLLSGNHGEIARWRAEQSRERTARTRPELL